MCIDTYMIHILITDMQCRYHVQIYPLKTDKIHFSRCKWNSTPVPYQLSIQSLICFILAMAAIISSVVSKHSLFYHSSCHALCACRETINQPIDTFLIEAKWAPFCRRQNLFSWLKYVVFWLKFHWNAFSLVQLAMSQICVRWYIGDQSSFESSMALSTDEYMPHLASVI